MIWKRTATGNYTNSPDEYDSHGEPSTRSKKNCNLIYKIWDGELFRKYKGLYKSIGDIFILIHFFAILHNFSDVNIENWSNDKYLIDIFL